MYIKPSEILKDLTDEEREYLEGEYDKELLERGYDIFDFNCTGLLEIERLDAIYCGYCGENVGVFDDVSDEDCAIEAERSGFCKIIPVDELPKNFEYRYFGWIDTPENRKNIRNYCRV